MHRLSPPEPAVSIAALLMGIALAAPLAACPYSIRDSAFIGRASRTPFRLVFLLPEVAGEGEATALREWVAAAGAGVLAGTNVAAEVATAVEAARLVPEAARELAEDRDAAAVLVSPQRKALRLASFPGDIPSREGVEALARSAVESPARLGLARRLVEAWCVVVLARGSRAEESQAALAAIEQASGRIAGTTTELGKMIARGPEVLAIEAGDPTERVLLWSLGLDAPAGAEHPPRIAFLAGRGETRGPVLEGAAITEEEAGKVLAMLGRSCSCTTSPRWLAGDAIPLRWGSDIQDLARRRLGFDPLDPRVLESIEGRRRPPEELSGPALFEDFALGYSEVAIEPLSAGRDEAPLEAIPPTGSPAPDTAAPAVPAVRPAATREAVSPGPDGSPHAPVHRMGRTALLAIGCLVALVATASILVLRCRKRPKPSVTEP